MKILIENGTEIEINNTPGSLLVYSGLKPEFYDYIPLRFSYIKGSLLYFSEKATYEILRYK